ncbi:MAG TPA: hypothetical protein EYP68_02370 [Candidatus Korarchaeota archaeon]|nr:hypothetical protein [Candidatus Korarchaeota archaeon]
MRRTGGRRGCWVYALFERFEGRGFSREVLVDDVVGELMALGFAYSTARQKLRELVARGFLERVDRRGRVLRINWRDLGEEKG